MERIEDSSRPLPLPMPLLDLVGEVAQQVQGFTPWLRQYGFRAGPSETLSALSALCLLDLTNSSSVMFGLQSVYSRSESEWSLFPTLYERYFLGRGVRLEERRRVVEQDAVNPVGRPSGKRSSPRITAASLLPGFSPDDGERFLLQVDKQGLKSVVDATKLAIRTMESPRGRRYRRGAREQIDLRRSLRQAMRYGGEPMRFAWRGRRPDRPRVVFLLDISGSMKAYAPFFTTLAWSFLRTRARVQLFVFSTSLLRVTGLVGRKGLSGMSVEELGGLRGLRGGTRIGQSLQQLLSRYPGLLARHTQLIVASDGFDAGPPEQLHNAMRDLRDRVGRIVWLNPLLGDANYQPTATGMSAALPYIDHFVDTHDVATWHHAVARGVFHA